MLHYDSKIKVYGFAGVLVLVGWVLDGNGNAEVAGFLIRLVMGQIAGIGLCVGVGKYLLNNNKITSSNI